MSQSIAERNPFMLMLQPEVVLAAMEKSERLSGLNRHLCRPLDRPAPATDGAKGQTKGVPPPVDDDLDDEV
jgi:hypothetical protein